MSKRSVVFLVFLVLLLTQSHGTADQSLDQSQFNQSQIGRPGLSGQMLPGIISQQCFEVYWDANSPANHYFPTGFMGDYSDIGVNPLCRENPHSGKTCFKVIYRNGQSQHARWVGVAWQNPAYNWGYRADGGFNLQGASKLVFWARGQKGGEKIQLVKVGGTGGEYKDSDEVKMGPVTLSSEWKQYEMDLRGKDLSSVSCGFSFVMTHEANKDGAVFYLDDIYYI